MKRDINCPHICPSSQNALNLLHFPRRFDIIRKHGKLVWLSRQSDSLVMNRSAVRIRPPAPQKPARLSGFPCSPWAYSYRSLTLSVACSTPLADQMRRLRYSVALALLTNPPTSSTQTQGINSSTPQGFAGCLRFYPSRKSKIFPRGTPDIYHTHIVKARFLRERVETLLYVKISLSRNIPLCNIKYSYINIFSAV